MRILFIVLMLSVFASFSVASDDLAIKAVEKSNPSFDCSKASTPVEKMICSDSLLGRLDVALTNNYKMMMAANIGDGAKQHLKTTQREWLTRRNGCADRDCLEAAYRSRIDEICDYPVVSGVHPMCSYSDDIK
jgi:uncharacterized protein